MITTGNTKYRGLILRFFIGLTVLFWGYEKLVVEKLIHSYTIDYSGFMPIDVNVFLQFAGIGQIIMGVCLITGLFTRIQAAIAVFMGLVTIIVPGMIVLRDVPHFAYAFAFTGGALVVLLEGDSPLSLDSWWLNKRSNRMSANTVVPSSAN